MSFFFGGRKQKTADGGSSLPQSIPAKPGTPLELVRYSTDTGKFEVPQASLDVLRKIRGPVGVVSVSGRARQASVINTCLTCICFTIPYVSCFHDFNFKGSTKRWVTVDARLLFMP